MRIEYPRVRTYFLVAGFVLGLFASEAIASGPPVLVGGTSGGGLSNTLIVGDVAYCSMHYGLLVLDLTDPGSPTVLSILDVGFTRGGVTSTHYRAVLRGRYLFMPFFESGALVFDVQDPSNPLLEAQIILPTLVKALAFSGNYMYAGGGRSTPLYTVDISDVHNPVVVDSTDVPVPVFDLTISGSFLYAAALFLFTFDISDPANPISVAVHEGPTLALSVAVRGNSLFIADLYTITFTGLEGIGAFDLSDPSTPVLVGHPGYHGGDQDAQPIGNFLYVVHEGGGLHALDVSDLTNPVMVECFGVGALPNCVDLGFSVFSSALSVTIIDGYAYMSTVNGLYVYTLDSRGDCNDDGVKNSADIIWLVNFVFKSGPPPVGSGQGNTECLGGVTTADIVYLVNFIFKGSDPPVCP